MTTHYTFPKIDRGNKPLCCICYEDITNDDDDFDCRTCKEGMICRKCSTYYDPHGSWFRDEKNPILCPCCKTPNWRYHYWTMSWYYKEDLPSLLINDLLKTADAKIYNDDNIRMAVFTFLFQLPTKQGYLKEEVCFEELKNERHEFGEALEEEIKSEVFQHDP